MGQSLWRLAALVRPSLYAVAYSDHLVQGYRISAPPDRSLVLVGFMITPSALISLQMLDGPIKEPPRQAICSKLQEKVPASGNAKLQHGLGLLTAQIRQTRSGPPAGSAGRRERNGTPSSLFDRMTLGSW